MICLLLLIPLITHSPILLERLSAWFGINSTALSCIKSYLLNRSFRPYVTIEHLVFVHQQIYGVPQGFVLCPLLFILYTTPLSTVQWRSQDLMKRGPIQGVWAPAEPQPPANFLDLQENLEHSVALNANAITMHKQGIITLNKL